MWRLSGNRFSATATPRSNQAGGALVVTGNQNQPNAPLLQIRYGSQWQQLGLVSDQDAVESAIAIPTDLAATWTIDLSAQDWANVEHIQAGNQVFAAALNPATPQPGEFVIAADGKSVTLTLPNQPLTPGLKAKVIGTIRKIPTNVVSPSLVQALRGLPVTGKITWSLSAEQHPSGSLALYCLGGTVNYLRSRFQKGTEIEIGGIGFSVGEVSAKLNNTTQYPQNFWEVSVPLTGKWARSKYNEFSFFKRTAADEVDEATLDDPNCNLNLSSESGSALRPNRISISKLARQVGARFSAGSPGGGGAFRFEQEADESVDAAVARAIDLNAQVKPGYIGMPRAAASGSRLGPWDVLVPPNAPNTAGVQWMNAARDLRLKNGCFLDFNHPSAVRARGLNSVRQWFYTVPEIEIGNQGDCERSPDWRGFGFEYKNARIEGEFNAAGELIQEESTQGQAEVLKPRWKQRKQEKDMVPTGTKNPRPPSDTSLITTLSLNWDVSGPTEEYTETETIDGQPSRVQTWIWGWAYTADQIADAEGYLRGAAGLHWQVVEYRNAVYEYDSTYRLLVKVVTRGWSLRRFKQESDEALETLSYDPAAADDLPYLNLYRFRSLPIYEVQEYRYAQFIKYYKDFRQLEEPGYVIYQVPTRLGTCERRVAFDPNWQPAFFLEEELHYSNTFAATPNPDSTPDFRLPDLMVGEEKKMHRRITILPSTNTRIVKWRSDMEKSDSYIEEVTEHAPQGPGFEHNSARSTRSTREGKPQKAEPLPPLYELEDPQRKKQKQDEDEDTRPRYEYRIATPGWQDRDGVRDSYSDSTAETISEVIRSAKTNLQIQDILDSLSYSYAIPFNPYILPFDRVQVRAGGESHATRVKSISQDLEISSLDGDILLRGEPTRIEAGIDRKIPLRQKRVRLPKRPDDNGDELIIVNPRFIDLEIGQILPRSVRSRRNPYGAEPT